MSKNKYRKQKLKIKSKKNLTKNHLKSLFRVYICRCSLYAKKNNLPLDEVLDMVADESSKILIT